MSQSRRDQMIAAAARLLDEGGPAAVTLRGVGSAAGVSHNAPYKHFADKDELLAAVASRELSRRRRWVDAETGAAMDICDRMHKYVAWAMRYPERFKLTFGRWTRHHSELAEAASEARRTMVAAVSVAQRRRELPSGDPERMASLLLALAHGAADLAQSGHLQRGGKGAADPDDLVDDLFKHLRVSARAVSPAKSE